MSVEDTANNSVESQESAKKSSIANTSQQGKPTPLHEARQSQLGQPEKQAGATSDKRGTGVRESRRDTIFKQGQTPESDQLHARPKTFRAQLIKQWEAAATGGAVTFVEAEVDNIIIDRETGTIILPKDPAKAPSLKSMLEATAAIAKDLDGSQRTRIEVYARNLKDTAILLAQQKEKLKIGQSEATALFNDAVVEELFNTAVEMEAAIKGKEVDVTYTRAEIEAEKIKPPLYHMFPEKEEEDKRLDLADERTQQRIKAVIMFALGKKELTVPGEEQTLYERWFEIAKKRGKIVVDEPGKIVTGSDGQQYRQENRTHREEIQTHQEFEEYVMDHFTSAISFVAQAVNKGEETRQRMYQSVAAQGEEAILEALSKRGEQLQERLMGYGTIVFSPETGRALDTATQEFVNPTKLRINVEKRLADAEQKARSEQRGMSTTERLIALNQAVAETYKIPEDSTLKNYAPIEALQDENGEFACTIRARVLKTLIGDDELVFGTSELGHMALFILDKDSVQNGNPTGHYVSTGGSNGYTVVEITDAEQLQPLIDAINVDPDDVNIHMDLQKGGELDKPMTIANFNESFESNVWVNLAIAGVDEDGNSLDRQTQLLYADRARLLDPNNPNAWRLIAQLTQSAPAMEALHRTALKKVHALDPDPRLTDEMILTRRGTVDAPLIAPADISTLITDPSGKDQAYIELVLNPKVDQDQFTEEDIKKARNILIAAYVMHPTGSPERAAIEDVLNDVNDIEKNNAEKFKKAREPKSPYPNIPLEIYQSTGRDAISDEDYKKADKVFEILKRRNNGKTDQATPAELNDAVNYIKELTRDLSPTGDDFSKMYVELASRFDETREMIINRILFAGYKAEQANYELNPFYTTPRLDQLIITFLNDAEEAERQAGIAAAAGDDNKAKEYRDKAADYRAKNDQYYNMWKTTAELFHTTNKIIKQGDVEQWGKIARALNSDQLNYISQVHGSGAAMDIYEDEYKRMRARDREITSDGYLEIQNKTVRRLKQLNRDGFLRSQFENNRIGAANPHIMDEWELNCAMSAGRTMYNSFLRSSMHISLGDAPSGGTSYVQGKFPEVMNGIVGVNFRWKIGKVLGGLQFGKDVEESWYDRMTDREYLLGKNKIYSVGGMKVETIHAAALAMTNDILTGYRIVDVAFPVIYVEVNGKPVNLKEYLGSFDFKKGSDAEKIKQLKEIVENTDMGLGPLLTSEPFWDGEDPQKWRYEGRKAIWEKVAETNLPVMMDFLTGLTFAEKDKKNNLTIENLDSDGKQKTISGYGENGRRIESFEDIVKRIWKYDWKALHDPNDTTYTKQQRKTALEKIDTFREKLDYDRKIYEAEAMRKSENSEVREKYEKILLNRQTHLQRGHYNPEEIEIMDAITKNGRAVAPQLADMYWPTPPFLDVPFEELDYTRFASNEYWRKAGDTYSLSQVNQALYTMSKNPGGLLDKGTVENLQMIKNAIEDPNGSYDAVFHVAAVAKTVLDWQIIKKGQRQAIFHIVKNKVFQSATSESQEWGGQGAEALSQFEISARIKALQVAGVIDKHAAIWLRKKTSTWLLALIWEICRDFLVLSPGMVGKQLVDELAAAETSAR